MPIITSSDLSSNIYPEIIIEITRGDTTITESVITSAIQEAKMYLSKYDIVQLFGTGSKEPTIVDEFLKSIVKDIACWRLIKLSNPSIDYSVFRTAYEDALKVLNNIMTGQMQPEGWIYAETNPDSIPQGNSISWSSNEKRNNYY